MRIIAGKFKGRRLATFKGDRIRPTSDRVKGAVFSILRERVVGANFLDLCSGTGNIGLEALSRGAKSVTFIDRHQHAIRLIESNLERCGLHRRHPQVRLIKGDVQKGLAHLSRSQTQFNLIYFDPPYDSNIYHICLKSIAIAQLLSPSGWMVVEHRKMKGSELSPLLTVDTLVLIRHEKYGKTGVSFYNWKAENEQMSQ